MAQEDILKVDDLLESLRSVANYDSSGTFSIEADPRRIHFKLASPQLYCLKWIQAACSAGAKSIHWSSNPKTIKCDIAGWSMPPERVLRLPALLFHDGSSRSERYLSAGFNGLADINVASLRIRTGKFEYSWKPSGFEMKPDQMGNARDLQILVQRSLYAYRHEMSYSAWNEGLLSTLFGTGQDREQKMLRRHACLCPLDFYVNGRVPEARLLPYDPTFFEPDPSLHPSSEKWVRAEKNQGVPIP